MSAQEDFDKRAIWSISGGAKEEPLRTCDFCSSKRTSRLRFQDWPICEKCSSKLKNRIKLILDFQ